MHDSIFAVQNWDKRTLKTVSDIAIMKNELLQEISRTTVKPSSRAADLKTTSVPKQRKSSKELSTIFPVFFES